MQCGKLILLMDWEPNTASYTGVKEFEGTVWFHSADVT